MINRNYLISIDYDYNIYKLMRNMAFSTVELFSINHKRVIF